jgi:hypothetical protein
LECKCPGEAVTSRGLTHTEHRNPVKVSKAYKSPDEPTEATVEIPLTRGYVARIDAADIKFAVGRKWNAAIVPRRDAVYAQTKINGKNVYLHRLLCPGWAEVDHADGDGLNNCRSNLRDGTEFRNRANTKMKSGNAAGFKGVYRAESGNYVARIGVNKKQIYLGIYGTPGEAADAYDRAAVSYFGEYAKTNAMLGRVVGRAGEGKVARPRRGRGPSRTPRARCSAGHAYTPENTYIRPDGQRACRQCASSRRRKSREPNPRARGKACPPGCTCGRHRKREQAA